MVNGVILATQEEKKPLENRKIARIDWEGLVPLFAPGDG
jgi:hypothetical protein